MPKRVPRAAQNFSCLYTSTIACPHTSPSPPARVFSMLSCRACLWRCIHALDAASSAGRQRRFLRAPSYSIHTVAARPGSLTQVEELSRSQNEPWQKSARAAGLKKKEKKALARQPTAAGGSKTVALDKQERIGRRDPSVSPEEWGKRRKELQHLKDPLELASFVKQELKKHKAAAMLQLVQMASHSMQCVVSWNHLIDHHLAAGKVAQALKIYNDMKKRAQFPDSYTYTILLRGLSINAHRSGTLEKALSVYHSMSAPNSRVEPSIIHTNAALKVCARALDMDALWGIAGKIPETGPGSANAITYVTILNAIRQSLLVNVPLGENEEQTAIRRERGIMEGRRIWEDIITKWRNVDLVIEEELVCAMGRLLLIGARPRDWDDVLSLVEQTMDIPRLVPRLGTPARAAAGYPQLRAPNVPEQFRFDDDHLSPSKGPARGDEFLPVATQGVASAVSSHLTYATPSNNTLSMIQEACLKVAAGRAANEYWFLLTDPTTYGVKPDVNNLNYRLRLLRQNRESASVARLMTDEFAAQNLEPRAGTFRIAMSTCVRDKNNHNSLKHAGQVLDLMMKKLEDADPKTVTKYVELAISFPLAKGDDYVDALARLDPVVRNIRLQLGVGGAPESPEFGASYLNGDQRQEAIVALRKICGLFDKLINSHMISEEQKQPYKAEKARLSSFLHRLSFKDTGGTKKWAAEKWLMAKEALEKDFEDKGVEKVQQKGVMGGLFNKATSWRKLWLPAEKRNPWPSPKAESAA